MKFAGVPQTNEMISAASGPKFTILQEYVRIYCCLTGFFPIVDTCLICEDIARQSCAMVPRWRVFASFLRPVFSASRVQHISDMHPQFALKGNTMYGSMVDIQCPTAEIRRGNKKRRKMKPQDENIYVRILLCRAAIKSGCESE